MFIRDSNIKFTYAAKKNVPLYFTVSHQLLVITLADHY